MYKVNDKRIIQIDLLNGIKKGYLKNDFFLKKDSKDFIKTILELMISI